MKLYRLLSICLIVGLLGFTDIANANWNCDINFVLSFGEYGSADDQLVGPAGIAVKNGYIYVNDSNNHCFKKFDLNGNFILKWYPDGILPGEHTEGRDLAADNEGNIYTVNSRLDDIQKFDSNGNFILKWGEFGNGHDQFDYANGIAIDENNNIYVADAWQNRVQKFDSDGNFIAKWGNYGSKQGEFDNPRGLACSNGYIYVTDNDNNRIQKFDLEGNFIIMWGTEGQGNGEFSRPLGITIDSDEHIFVTDDGRVQIFDTNGDFLAKFGTFGSNEGELSHAAYIDVDNEGNVYIVDQDNNRVQKFNYNIEKLSSQIIFEDNFDDGIIDDSKWYLSCAGKRCVDAQPGKTVEEIDGILRVAADETDNRGVIFSQPITIDTSKLLVIERRTKIHYGHSSCYRDFLRVWDTEENYYSAVSYQNCPAHDRYYVGFGNDAYFDPIWDEWFDEKLTYNMITGEATYSVNGETPVVHNFDPLQGKIIKLSFSSGGWFTGHETQVDYVKVTQANSSQYHPSIAVHNPSSNIEVTQGDDISIGWTGEDIAGVGISRDEDNLWGNENYTILEENLAATGSITLSTADWPAGTYYICVWSQDDSQQDGYVYNFSNATFKISEATTTYYYDADGDGYGNPDQGMSASTQPPGYVADNTDCDDTDSSVNPGANNCNKNISHELLAKYYSPVIYQHVDVTGDRGERGNADLILNFDYDGNWSGNDQWANLANLDSNQAVATVYYSVTESSNYWFIYYAIYHPRDWSNIDGSTIISNFQHENDMEAVTMMVKKENQLPYGQLLAAMAMSHNLWLEYAINHDLEASNSNGVGNGVSYKNILYDDGSPVENFVQGGKHPRIYIQSRGHGIFMDENSDGCLNAGNINRIDDWDDTGFPSDWLTYKGTGVVYFCSDNDDGDDFANDSINKYLIDSGTDDLSSPDAYPEKWIKYELCSISELWDRRTFTVNSTSGHEWMYAEENESFYGEKHGWLNLGANKANPPWSMPDIESYSTICSASDSFITDSGEIYYDPLNAFAKHFNDSSSSIHKYIADLSAEEYIEKPYFIAKDSGCVPAILSDNFDFSLPHVEYHSVVGNLSFRAYFQYSGVHNAASTWALTKYSDETNGCAKSTLTHDLILNIPNLKFKNVNVEVTLEYNDVDNDGNLTWKLVDYEY